MVAKRVGLLVPVIAALAAQLPGTGFPGQAEGAARTGAATPETIFSATRSQGVPRVLDIEKPAEAVPRETLKASAQVIVQRLHGFGIANASVRLQGEDIAVEFPDGKDQAQALDLISEKGQLLIRPVDCIISAYVPLRPSATSPSGQGPCQWSSQQQQRYLPPAGDPNGVTPAQYDLAGNTVVLPYYAGARYGRYVLGPAEVSGHDVKKATAFLDPEVHGWIVGLSFTSAGSAQFNMAARRHYKCYESNMEDPPYCSLEAMEMDGTVEAAPAIEAPSFPAGATIVGSTSDPFTQRQAANLALLLGYGPLPVRFISQG